MIGDEQTHTLPDEPDELRSGGGALRLCRRRCLRRRSARQSLPRSRRITARCSKSCRRCPRPAPSIVLPSDEGDPGRACRAREARLPQSAAGHRRGPRLAVRPLPRHAQRARARAADRIPALAARCVRPHRRPRPRARHLRQGHGRDAGRRAALLAACRQSEPAAADRRHHGDGAAACAHPRPPPRLLDAVLDPGFFGAVPTPAKLKELVVSGAGTSVRLSGRARPRRASSAASRASSSACG